MTVCLILLSTNRYETDLLEYLDQIFRSHRQLALLAEAQKVKMECDRGTARPEE